MHRHIQDSLALQNGYTISPSHKQILSAVVVFAHFHQIIVWRPLIKYDVYTPY